MKPSYVRARILQDHVALRVHLVELNDAVVAMLADHVKVSRVRELAHGLLSDLTQHTQLEDAILAPALKELDAWGEVRASQLLTHHQSQRAQIRELSELYDLPLQAHDVARATLGFIEDLRTDMEHEERDLLNIDLLRDDIITVGAECG